MVYIIHRAQPPRDTIFQSISLHCTHRGLLKQLQSYDIRHKHTLLEIKGWHKCVDKNTNDFSCWKYFKSAHRQSYVNDEALIESLSLTGWSTPIEHLHKVSTSDLV